MRPNKLSRVINVIYDGVLCRRTAHACVPGHPPMGGKRRRRWRTEAGSEGEREKLNERDRANLRGASTTKLLQQSKQVELQTGFSPFLPAWLLSSRKYNFCSVKFWCGGWGGSPLVKMDHVIRTRSRRRTPLLLFILLHVTTTHTGKVSSWTPADK